MKPFKFFQKEVKGTLELYEGETRSTAFAPDLYGQQESYHLTRQRIDDQESQERMMNRLRTQENHRDFNDYLEKIFQSTRATRVNPNWKIKIKMFFQKINIYILYDRALMSVIIGSTCITVGVILIISKILNVW